MSRIVESAKRIAERARKAPARAAVAAVAAVALVGGGLVAAQAASGNDLIAWAQTAIEQKADEIAYAATDGLEAVQAAMGASDGAAGEVAAVDSEASVQGASVEDGALDAASESAEGASAGGAQADPDEAGSKASAVLQDDGTVAYTAAVGSTSEGSAGEGAQMATKPASSGLAGMIGGLLGQTTAEPSQSGASGALSVGEGVAAGRADQLSIEVPSGMACAVMADGTVVVPDQPVKNTGGVDAVVKSVRLEQADSASQVLTTPDTVTWSVANGASSWDIGGGADGAQVDVSIAAGGEAAFEWGCELGGAALLGAGGGKFADVLYTVEAVDLEPYATIYEDGSMIFTLGEPTDEEAALYGGGTAIVGQWTGFADVSYGAREDVPWYADRAAVKDVTVVEPLAPASMGYWFCEMSNLETVDFEKLDASKSDSFYRLFYSCSSLKEFDEPGFDGASSDSVERMFDGCSSIVKINAPKLVSAACTSAEDFAQDCAALTSLDVSGWDTSNVETFAYFLDGCASLEQCDLSGFDTGASTSFSAMMQGCEKLVTPGDLSGWDMRSAQSLSSMFYQCYAMTGLGDLSGWEFTGSLDSLRNMFAECYVLTDVGNLDDWNVASCTTLRGMFVNCQKLVNIGDISNWQVGNVESLERTFVDCFVLPHIGDLSNWDVSNVDDFELTFAECQAVTSLGDLSGWRAPKATTYESCFQGCQSLESIGDLSQWPMGNVTSTDSMFERCLEVPTLGDLGTWVMPLNTSYASMFSECYALTYVGDISGWQTGASTSFRQFMYACYNIDGVGDLGGWDLSAATNLQQMFYDCQKLSSVGDLSAWQVGAVETFRLTFGNMYSATSFGDLSAWDVHSATTLYGMFDQTDKVASLGDLGGWDVANVENFRGVFGGMESLREVGDLSAWNTAKGTNFYGMFHDTALEELDLSGWDTRSAVDMTSMFSGMKYLQEVTVGDAFSFDGDGTMDAALRAKFPTPSATHIPGADGLWHAASDGAAYAAADVPNRKADTYYAVVPEEAYATLYANGTMVFTMGEPTAEQAAEYGGAEDAAVSGQWRGFEDDGVYVSTSQVLWYSQFGNVKKVVVAESMKPAETALWFYNMSNMTECDLTLLDTSSVTCMTRMFGSCSSLTSLTLPEAFDTSNVTDMNSMFSFCYTLARLKLPESFDTSNVTNVSGIFQFCNALERITYGEKFGEADELPTNNWWDVATGEKFTKSTMNNRAGTYVNKQSLVGTNSLAALSPESVAGDLPLAAIEPDSAQVEGADSETTVNEKTTLVEGEEGGEGVTVPAAEGTAGQEPSLDGEPGEDAAESGSGSDDSSVAATVPDQDGAESASSEGDFDQGEASSVEGIGAAGGEDTAVEEGRHSPVSFGVADGKEDGEVIVEVYDAAGGGIEWSVEDARGSRLEWTATVDGTLDDEDGTLRFKGDGEWALVASVGKESAKVGVRLSLAHGDEYGVELGGEIEGAGSDEGAVEDEAVGADEIDGAGEIEQVSEVVEVEKPAEKSPQASGTVSDGAVIDMRGGEEEASSEADASDGGWTTAGAEDAQNCSAESAITSGDGDAATAGDVEDASEDGVFEGAQTVEVAAYRWTKVEAWSAPGLGAETPFGKDVVKVAIDGRDVTDKVAEVAKARESFDALAGGADDAEGIKVVARSWWALVPDGVEEYELEGEGAFEDLKAACEASQAVDDKLDVLVADVQLSDLDKGSKALSWRLAGEQDADDVLPRVDGLWRVVED